MLTKAFLLGAFAAAVTVTAANAAPTDYIVASMSNIDILGILGGGSDCPPPPPTKVPEPATLTLLGAAVVGLGLARRRRRD